jgi:hypothetical protein
MRLPNTSDESRKTHCVSMSVIVIATSSCIATVESIVPLVLRVHFVLALVAVFVVCIGLCLLLCLIAAHSPWCVQSFIIQLSNTSIVTSACEVTSDSIVFIVCVISSIATHRTWYV